MVDRKNKSETMILQIPGVETLWPKGNFATDDPMLPKIQDLETMKSQPSFEKSYALGK
jgi:hypothetical protein